MLAEYKRTTNLGVGIGILVSVAGRFVIIQGHPQLGMLVTLAGFILFIWGCGQYCRGKGQNPWLGLFGVLSIFGLIILFFLPDKRRES